VAGCFADLFVKTKFVDLTENPTDASVTSTDENTKRLEVLEQSQPNNHRKQLTLDTQEKTCCVSTGRSKIRPIYTFTCLNLHKLGRKLILLVF